jgi:hypothetical protein
VCVGEERVCRRGSGGYGRKVQARANGLLPNATFRSNELWRGSAHLDVCACGVLVKDLGARVHEAGGASGHQHVDAHLLHVCGGQGGEMSGGGGR